MATDYVFWVDHEDALYYILKYIFVCLSSSVYQFCHTENDQLSSSIQICVLFRFCFAAHPFTFLHTDIENTCLLDQVCIDLPYI